MNIGHPKHVLQTQNCVFLPQNNYYFRAVGPQYGTAILLVPFVVGKEWQGLMHCQPHINVLKATNVYIPENSYIHTPSIKLSLKLSNNPPWGRYVIFSRTTQ